MYIHQTENWPNFTWDKSHISLKLAKVNKAAGFLEGRLSAIGFDVRQQAAVEVLTHDIVGSSEIEGVVLNSDFVWFCSSIVANTSLRNASYSTSKSLTLSESYG